MVAHDELGGLLPIKRTIRVIDAQNQHFREQEVSGRGCRGEKGGLFIYLFIYLRGEWDRGVPSASRSPRLRGGGESSTERGNRSLPALKNAVYFKFTFMYTCLLYIYVYILLV